MAFPFKTGGDFYNCEAQRMRLHNLGANPTETATGLMYFNTGTSNLGKHAVVHDGTNFKALAFVDEIATNTAFTELANRVLTIEKALGEDTANVIDTWEEIQNFLKDIDDNDANLMTMLNDKLSLSQGGVMTGTIKVGNYDAFGQTGGNFYLGTPDYPLLLRSNGTTTINGNALIHSGNYNSYAPKLDGTGASGTWGINISGKAATASALLISTFKYAFVNGNNVLFGYETAQNNYDTILAGKNVSLRYGVTPSIGFWLNSSGNVTIGRIDQLSDSTTTKLYVDGGIRFAPRTIWGQSFDGTGNVSGALSGVTNINSALYINSSGNVTIGGSDLAGTDAKLYVDGCLTLGGLTQLNKPMIKFARSGDYFDLTGNFVFTPNSGSWSIFSESSSNTLFRVLKSGNVGIGTASPAYKLDVSGTGRFTDAVTMESTLTVGGNITPSTNNAYTLGTSSNQWSHLYAVGATFSGDVSVNGATTLGSTLSVSGAATLSSAVTIKGDLVVEGNIIGKKEVSAGGVGQEGESGAGGGAEVISQTLASGASSYTITNTIKRSDIAVSLYEWNASGNSWDMCLADISVTASNITVTFGSATTVNHKLVAVG